MSPVDKPLHLRYLLQNDKTFSASVWQLQADAVLMQSQKYRHLD